MTEDFIEVEEDVSACLPGTPVLSFPEGFFSFRQPLPTRGEARSGSGKKLVYRGTYVRVTGGVELKVPACAVFFVREGADLDYARERVGLMLGSAMGVGPRILEAEARRRLPDAAVGETPHVLLIEEDAGVSLEDALCGAPIPLFEDGAWHVGSPLAPAGTPEGARASHKILFDILSQVRALHDRGLYHRDIRSANIALMAWGARPEDVRATLLDLEFLGIDKHGRVSCAGYYDRLFGTGGLVPLGREPTLLEQDLGYLAVVEAEIMERLPAKELPDEAVLRVLTATDGPLVVGERVFTRCVSPSDVCREARLAGLPTALSVFGGISGEAVRIAERETRHNGFIDALDRIRLERSIDMILEQSTMESLARAIFEDYKLHRIRDGKEVEYETFDDQPKDFKESCFGQARSYRDKMHLLGYELVRAEECPDEDRVHEFTADEVEFLAREEHDRWVDERRRAGWTYGPKKDVEKRISPFMVVWDELDEEIREYDREPVREMISLIESAGLAVRR